LLELEKLTEKEDGPFVHEKHEHLSMLLDTDIHPLMEQFRSEGRATSPTFLLWDDFLYRVMMPIKTFIRPTRNGQWVTYQSSKAEFASNRSNYAGYMPVLQIMMKQLPHEVAESFKSQMILSNLY
jgi:hypothetical protein